jgi:hypothetical protein
VTPDLLEDEDGAILLFALAFLALVGVAAAAVLGVVSAGTTTTERLRDQGQDVYAAGGGVEAYIARMRTDLTLGSAGNCPDETQTIAGRSVAVTCAPAAGSRALTGGGSPSGVPAAALISLASGSEPGVVVRNNDSSGLALRIGGGIRSATTVSAPNGPVQVDGAVTVPVPTACSGDLRSPNPLDPSASLPLVCTSPSGATDPGYPRATSSEPAAATIPTSCSGTLPAGTYRDAAALSDWLNGCPGTVTLSGTYHLDFTNTTAGAGCSAPHELCLRNRNVTLRAGTVHPTDRSACVAGSGGAQLILAGDSRVSVESGTLQLCPPESAGARVSIHAGGATTTPATSTTTLEGTVTNLGNGQSVYTTPDGARRESDGTVAVGPTGNGNRSPRLQVATFGAVPTASAIPSNATILSATLRLRHQEAPGVLPTATIRSGSASATFTATSTCSGTGFCSRAVLATDRIDVTSVLSTPAAVAAATAEFGVSGSNTASLVDGVTLEVAWRPRVFGAQSGCVIATPYTDGSGPCAVLTVNGSNTDVDIRGTIYAPASAVDLRSVNRAGTVASRGIVARTIRLHVPTLQDFSDFFVSVPGAASLERSSADVTLTARVGTDPRPVVVARVELDRTTPTVPAIRSWTVEP